MSVTKARLLLATNGAEATRPAMDYGARLAEQLQAEVLLLGVLEERGGRAALQRLLDETAQTLDRAGVANERLEARGRLVRAVADLTRREPFLTVVGPLGRAAWRRWLTGRSFRRLMGAVRTPLLYVPGPHRELARILVCLAGLGYARTVEGAGLVLARLTNAYVTVLHVVEPVTFDYPTARAVQEHWQEILETDTPLARNLGKGLAAAEAAGLATDFKVRHGHAVHEILAEVQEGHYDLIVMGSPHSAGGLRKLFTPNVTAEVAEAAGLPVLTGRYSAGVAL